jgi:DMSO/TMAO reductase YedYZ heme-binding membrane subunit
MYLMLVLGLASNARSILRPRAWRLVHRLSFLGFTVSLIHARFAGPDASEIWVRTLYIATVVMLTGLLLVSLYVRARQAARRQRPVMTNERPALSER